MRSGVTHLAFDATVLQLRNYGEADRIVEFLSEPHGRISVLARGARASRRRFAGVLDRFVSVHVQVRVRPGLWHLDAADIRALRLGLRESWERLQRAHRLCELARVLSPEGEPSQLYPLLAIGLDALSEGSATGSIKAMVGMVRAAGLLPDLEACSQCGQRAAVVMLRAGVGAWCARCAPADQAMPEVIAVLRGNPALHQSQLDAVEELLGGVVATHTGKAMRSFA